MIFQDILISVTVAILVAIAARRTLPLQYIVIFKGENVGEKQKEMFYSIPRQKGSLATFVAFIIILSVLMFFSARHAYVAVGTSIFMGVYVLSVAVWQIRNYYTVKHELNSRQL